MKYLTFVFIASALLAGCAQDAFYADREYGIASTDAFDRQIVHKDYVHAGKTSDAMEGIHAEPIMEMYHESFSEGFTQESIDISDTTSN
jgi:hypothetical protein